MVKIFSRSTLAQLLFILAALLLLWFRCFANPVAPAVEAGDAVLYRLVASLFASAPVVALVLTMAAILVEGVWVNLLLANAGLVSKSSLLPAFLYVLLMSVPARSLPPALFVNAALILYADRVMLRSTLLAIPTDKICSATALVSVCTLFHLPSAAFLLSYLLVAVSYRLYSWRDWAALALGLLAPYTALVAVLYLCGDLPAWWNETLAALAAFRPGIASTTALHTAAHLTLAAALLASIALFASKIGEHPVVWQKNALAVTLCAVGAAAMLLCGQLFPPSFHYFAVPFALTGTALLAPRRNTNRRRKYDWLPDSLLLLLIVSAFLC